MIEAGFQTSAVDACRLVWRRIRRGLPLGAIALGALGAGFGVWEFGLGEDSWPKILLAGILPLVAGIVGGIAGGMFVAYLNFLWTSPSQREGVIVGDSRGIRVRDGKGNMVAVPWASIRETQEEPDYFIFFIKPFGQLQVPTRDFSEYQKEGFRSLMRAAKAGAIADVADAEATRHGEELATERQAASSTIEVRYTLMPRLLVVGSIIGWRLRDLLMTVVPCILLVYMFWDGPWSTEDFPWIVVLVLGIFLLFAAFGPLYVLFQARRLGPSHRETVATFEADGVRFRNEAGGQSLVRWVSVRRVVETKEGFWLFVGAATYPLPKSAFDSGQIARLRSLLRQAGVRAKLDRDPG